MDLIDEPIVVFETFSCTIEELWSAITDIKEMEQWFFAEMLTFEATPGFYTEFMLSVEDRTFTHQFTILEVVPNELIVQQWCFEEYPGKGHVSFAISTEGDNTVLQLTSEIIDPFPTDVPEFKRESGVGGWNYFIKDRLKNYMDNKKKQNI